MKKTHTYITLSTCRKRVALASRDNSEPDVLIFMCVSVGVCVCVCVCVFVCTCIINRLHYMIIKQYVH